MDLGVIVLVLIVVGMIGVLVRRLLSGVPLRYQWGWLMAVVIVLAVAGLSFLFMPDNAIYITGAVWFFLFCLPFIGIFTLNYDLSRKRYSAAYNTAEMIAFIHPADGFREQPLIMRATILAQKGEFSEITQLFSKYINKKPESYLGRIARIYLYRFNNQWEELVHWVEATNSSQNPILKSPTILMLYLRALGEIGEVEQLVRVYSQHRKLLKMNYYTDQANLLLFAYCGETKRVAALLRGYLKHYYSKSTKQFWLATAEITSGELDRGLPQMTALLDDPDWLIRSSAQYRLSHPLAASKYQLSAKSAALLARIAFDVGQMDRITGYDSPKTFRPLVTCGLILLNLVYFGVELAQGGSENLETLYNLGALVVPDIISTGEWWRLLAAQFLHFGLVHLIVNMACLLIIGWLVEYNLKSWRYLVVYFSSGTGSLLLITLFTQLQLMPQEALVGASAGIMGLMGALGAILLRVWRLEGGKVARDQFYLILLSVGLQAFSDLVILPQASFAGHLGGAVLGFLLAVFLKHPARNVSRTLPTQDLDIVGKIS